MSDTVDARIGTRVAGRFLVEERVGAGATGVVYRAVQEPLGRRVALKVLTSKDAADARRFAREAKAIARLRHENVVVVHDVGEHEGTAFIAMEHVEGPTLKALLDDELAVAVVIDIAKGIARALSHAHANGVVHRDLKPQNVMLAGGRTDAASVRVVDFGLARVVEIEGEAPHEGSVSVAIEGTPAYMAPEQIDVGKTGHPGPACDVYALGVVMYEALAGTNPFRAETPFKTLMRHVEGKPPPPSALRPSIPAWLDALVEQMLAKNPNARPTSADVAARLDAAATSTPSDGVTVATGARGPVPVARAPADPPRTPRIALAVGGLVIVVLAALAGRALVVPSTAQLSVALIDAGSLSVVDAGSLSVALVDAGSVALVDAGSLSVALVDAGGLASDTRAPSDGGAVAAVDAGAPNRVRPRGPVDAGAIVAPAAPAALVKKVRALEGCRDPCAADVTARFSSALAGDFASLKAWRADLDACRARCDVR